MKFTKEELQRLEEERQETIRLILSIREYKATQMNYKAMKNKNHEGKTEVVEK